jgi:acetyl-CoA C-acetyltransferase
MLTGPIPATQAAAPQRAGIDDIDLVEINEAFASVVLAWAADTDADMAGQPERRRHRHGPPARCGTGCALTTKAVHELERTGGRYGLVTMCCGGGLGTGTLLERV